MIDTNNKKTKDKIVKLSPLRADEINSVIKSFQENSFSKEELYSNESNSFVKKTLFELAKDTEKNQNFQRSEENKEELEKNAINNEVHEVTKKIENQPHENDIENTVLGDAEKKILKDVNDDTDKKVLNNTNNRQISEIKYRPI